MGGYTSIMSQTKTRIVKFEGIIGAGKSTAIKYLAAEMRQRGYTVYVVDESVEGWVEDGILQKFYEDPKRYSYHFQTKCFLDKVNKFMKAYEEYYGKVDFIFTERSMVSDYIFASLLHADKMMDEMEFKHYQEWYNFWKKLVPKPFQDGTTVYLKLRPLTAMKRIQMRNRDGEDHIKIEYETRLNDMHDGYFDVKANVVWDSAQDIHKQLTVTKLANVIDQESRLNN